ncbi:hypothetical protein [Lewinella sp. W8]|uniref:hypothetical protein n=1 Tax=Lewinella sp. W8 TaxID=2528208 RepID=UPI001068AFF5|nr:hypothetical protein [Lewinella sp. W8]MTB52810.1 hypothetical protein [Lewinella sp. W8]
MSKSHPIVECIAQVSVGRDSENLRGLAAALSSIPDCYLLRQDTHPDTQQAVLTLAGQPDAVFAGAYQLYAYAALHPDPQQDQADDSRIDAVTVCQFVPISGVKEKDLMAQAQVLAQRVAQDFHLPVFLDVQSAASPDQKVLADIRRGAYQGLAEKLRGSVAQPDYGPALPHPQLGATVIAVHPFHIAWNINLAPGASPEQAHTLAAKLSGNGPEGTPGLFPGLMATGERTAPNDRWQISCDLINPDKTDLARVYLTAVNLATGLGTRVTGSELLGLIPEKYLRKAGKSFSFDGDREGEIEAAVTILGLGDLAPFNWRERVLEEVLRSASAD